MFKRNPKTAGFTLIELLIVIAVLAILASMALPNLVGARKSANETNAIGQLRTLITAEEAYKSRNLGGSDKYATLAQLESKNLMVWPTTTVYKKSSYTFTDIGVPDVTIWGVFAKCDDLNSGDRDFLVSSDGFIRGFTTGGSLPATVTAAQNATTYPVLN